MDYVDFIVHVFSAEKRAFYGLERLRKSATTLSIADLNADLSARIAETRAKRTPPQKTPTKVGVKEDCGKEGRGKEGLAEEDRNENTPAKKIAKPRKTANKSAERSSKPVPPRKGTGR